MQNSGNSLSTPRPSSFSACQTHIRQPSHLHTIGLPPSAFRTPFHLFTFSFFMLCSMPSNSDFRIFSRGIVLPHRTTTGPTSDFCFLTSPPAASVFCPFRHALRSLRYANSSRLPRFFSFSHLLTLTPSIFAPYTLCPLPQAALSSDFPPGRRPKPLWAGGRMLAAA